MNNRTWIQWLTEPTSEEYDETEEEAYAAQSRELLVVCAILVSLALGIFIGVIGRELHSVSGGARATPTLPAAE